jgi:pimeloyl-ACP methyl ester carboxylesterase
LRCWESLEGLARVGVVPEPITLQTASVDFHAERRGSQPQAVFVHGFGGDLHTWDTVWQAMGDKLEALRYDLRGFGRSVCRRRVPFKHADDLLAMLDASEIECCDLVGVSMGGAIALNLTLDHPERVRSLVVISPGLVGWEWSDAWRALWQPIIDHARGGELAVARRLWWEHPLFSTTRASAAGQALFESIMRFAGEQWIHDDHEPMLPDLERLHLLKVRTLLMSGGRDFEDFRVIASLIEASASDVQRIEHPGLGHLLHLEDPEHCARAIGSFWQSSAAGRDS